MKTKTQNNDLSGRTPLMFFICLICTIFSLFGCSTYKKELRKKGYVVIPSRFRISQTEIKDLSNKDTLFFARKSNTRDLNIRIENISVKKGALSFVAKDGVVTITKENIMIVNKEGVEEVIFPMNRNDLSFMFLSKYSRFCIDIFSSGINSEQKSKWIDSFLDKKQMIPDIYLNLKTTLTNNYWLIEIPIKKTSDFEGNIGKIIILSNWY